MSARDFIHSHAPHPATLPPADLLANCEWGRTRSGGPGGQHRNKVETAVWIRHIPTQLEAQAAERRSAEQNKAVALGRLRRLLAVEVRCPVPLGEIRSELWKGRCSPQGVIVCNSEHDDFAALLAEALDVVCASTWDVKKASLRLCCSQSQLIKLFKDHPPAIVRLNTAREVVGLHPMK